MTQQSEATINELLTTIKNLEGEQREIKQHQHEIEEKIQIILEFVQKIPQIYGLLKDLEATGQQ